jgi:hypothetical protein
MLTETSEKRAPTGSVISTLIEPFSLLVVLLKSKIRYCPVIFSAKLNFGVFSR